MRRFVVLAVVVVVMGAACSEEAPAPPTTSHATPRAATSTTVPVDTTTTTMAEGAASTTTAPASTTTRPLADLELALEEVASGFGQPVFVTAPPDDPRLFVVDQPGVIWVIDGGDPTPFLDIRDDVAFNGEQGLLSVAFHPDYATNGRFYVDFTDIHGDTAIVEFTVSDDPNRADPDSARLVLSIDQPRANHNGGLVAFGPDGALWIGMGDGGGAGDPFGNGQSPDTLLGALLRIEVGPDFESYGIPPGNPGSQNAAWAPEVWATGLRNPWRYAFDDGLLYVADVGQDRIEEIDVVDAAEPGLDFGWSLMEGDACYQGDCDPAGLVLPAHTYTHDEGCSITGGSVYRGAAIPELAGQYFYADYCGGWIRSLQPGDGDPEVHQWFDPGEVTAPTSFGLDAEGELYVTSAAGTVYRLVGADR
ncbi:MAG: PQQ-dependent sugar dehydrogenase [Acidimicrobiia bacterium]|jgi:glucose/arabinose dehydrogenase